VILRTHGERVDVVYLRIFALGADAGALPRSPPSSPFYLLLTAVYALTLVMPSWADDAQQRRASSAGSATRRAHSDVNWSIATPEKSSGRRLSCTHHVSWELDEIRKNLNDGFCGITGAP
jgi:hypothetical protein